MNSTAYKRSAEQRKQDEIKAQIAALQAQLHVLPTPPESVSRTVPKRKRTDGKTLAPSTPSPKKRKIFQDKDTDRSVRSLSSSSVFKPSFKPSSPSRNAKVATRHSHSHGDSATAQLLQARAICKPAPSTVLSKLAKLSSNQTSEAHEDAIVRSRGFAERPSQPQPSTSVKIDKLQTKPYDDENHGPVCDHAPPQAPSRDDRLALVEDLSLGPVEHKPPIDDPNFENLEPNSGIRLSSRTIPHEDFQEYLTDRYYLSPSRLYSCIRLLPNKSAYDVPVEGDWVTIAVVAERGPIRFSKAPVGIGKADEGADEEDEAIAGGSSRNAAKGKEKEDAKPKPSGKRYVNLKLIDFGTRSSSSSKAMRGDAFLSLLVFESEGFDVIKGEREQVDGETRRKEEKVYKGGSRGAFESLARLKEGTVVALLNPRVLRPFQKSNDAPHPTNNILALTPESADSIAIIGTAKDLGMCTVVKRDGKVCGAWCDKRISDGVCEFHVQCAVERRRAGRAEFSAGTSGMSTSAAHKRKAAYDPARQWGLQPSTSISLEPGVGSTYVVSGHVVSSHTASASGAGMFVSENIGREGQAKAARKVTGHDADQALKKLLERDDGRGARAVKAARDFVAAKEKAKSKSKRTEKEGREGKLDKAKSAYSANMIKHLGFDPTVKVGQKSRKVGEEEKANELRDQLDTLASLQSTRRTDADLGRKPGTKARSSVIVPSKKSQTEPTSSEVRSRDADRDIRKQERKELGPVFGEPTGPLANSRPETSYKKLVDLDSSDTEP